MQMYMPETTVTTHPLHTCDCRSYELQQFNFQRYVSWYYNKETVQNIWNQTIQVYLVQGSFAENPKENVVHIPNPDPQLC
jgi:hypothetical protein